MIMLDEVVAIWAEHTQWVSSQREEWVLHRETYRTRMWKDGRPFGLSEAEVADKLPVQIEANRVESFVDGTADGLFRNAPAASVSLPAVRGRRAGPAKGGGDVADRVRAFLNDLLARASVQSVTEEALRLALLYGRAGMWWRAEEEADDPVERIRVDTVDAWDCVVDPHAQRGAERYRGVARLLLRRQAEAEGIPVDAADLIAGGDPLMLGVARRRANLPRSYVRVLTVWDLEEGHEQRFVLTEAASGGMLCREVGEAVDMILESQGRPICPMVPMIPLSAPGRPLDGHPAARRVAGINAEQNLLASIVFNAARRDAARVVMYKPGTFTDSGVKTIAGGYDLSLVEVASQEVNLDADVRALQMPPIPASIGQALGLVRELWQDVQGTSEIQQGRQQAYVSAREAGLLVAYGEQHVARFQIRASEALAEGCRVVLALTAEGPEVSVQLDGETRKLSEADLRVPWVITITDAGLTPASEAQRRTEFAEVAPTLLKLAGIAAGAPDESGAPAAPEIQTLARLVYDETVRLHRLRDEFTWGAVAEAARASPARPPDPLALAAQLQPGVPAGPPGAAGLPAAAPLDLPAAAAVLAGAQQGLPGAASPPGGLPGLDLPLAQV